jgi:hypothetical protein
MDAVLLPRDEGLHRRFRHEWWYFCAWLAQPATGRRFHYTTALMRNDAVWVSYHRWWPEGSPPTLRRSVHGSPVPTGTERWIRPRPDWQVLIAPGHSTHALGPVSLHFRSDAAAGPCLHTDQAAGGICRYGGANTMAWYSWPALEVRGRLQPGGAAESRLTGIGWMEHQWGGTDFRRLTWRYVPMLIEAPTRRRLVAWHYVHQDHPDEPTLAVGELIDGVLNPIPGTLSPLGPGPGPTTIDLGSRGRLVCTPDPGGAVDLGLPGVPRFHEAPSTVRGTLDGAAVSGVAMTEYNPSVS